MHCAGGHVECLGGGSHLPGPHSARDCTPRLGDHGLVRERREERIAQSHTIRGAMSQVPERGGGLRPRRTDVPLKVLVSGGGPQTVDR